MMKRRRSIAELIDGIADKRAANEAYDAAAGLNDFEAKDTSHLARLGEAFLARLNIPEGMDEQEAAERIIEMWNDSNAMKANAVNAYEDGSEEQRADETDDDVIAKLDGVHDEKRAVRLPEPIRGGLFEAPKADYESMSAEQFRKLKKQLERAAMNGRKVRL